MAAIVQLHQRQIIPAPTLATLVPTTPDLTPAIQDPTILTLVTPDLTPAIQDPTVQILAAQIPITLDQIIPGIPTAAQIPPTALTLPIPYTLTVLQIRLLLTATGIIT